MAPTLDCIFHKLRRKMQSSWKGHVHLKQKSLFPYKYSFCYANEFYDEDAGDRHPRVQWEDTSGNQGK